MSTLNVSDVNAAKVSISSGGLKLSSHNGSGNYPSAETGLMIYDSSAGGAKLYTGSQWANVGGGSLDSGDRSGRSVLLHLLRLDIILKMVSMNTISRMIIPTKQRTYGFLWVEDS